MHFFNKYPKCRLVFALIYVCWGFIVTITTYISIINTIINAITIIAACDLFGAYIAVVKSGIIKDKNADSISNLIFDLISLTAAVELIRTII